MPAETAPPAQLKDWFDEDRYHSLAELFRSLSPRFDRARFLTATVQGLETRSLMQRLHQTTLALHETLPGGFKNQVAVLKDAAPGIEHNFVGIFLSDFVATYGLEQPAFSLDALRFFTRFGSAEFAVRPFLQQDLVGTLRVMQTWTDDASEDVRRLASEGSRPRLPWGLRLQALVKNPDPTGPILDALRDDPSLYVRKSVANHLNDITKDHPDWVLRRLEGWQLPHSASRQWIARHACRTLIKRGHSQALALFGFGHSPVVTAALTASPPQLSLGQTLTLRARITAPASHPKPQTLAIDYLVHYVKADGSTSAKVFKWTETVLAPGASLDLVKNQTVRDFTTRRHYPGRHRVELQINGHRLAETAFDLG